jgi:hypothetical protein
MYPLLILLVLQAKLIGILDVAQLLGVSSDSIRSRGRPRVGASDGG